MNRREFTLSGIMAAVGAFLPWKRIPAGLNSDARPLTESDWIKTVDIENARVTDEPFPVLVNLHDGSWWIHTADNENWWKRRGRKDYSFAIRCYRDKDFGEWRLCNARFKNGKFGLVFNKGFFNRVTGEPKFLQLTRQQAPPHA